MDEPERLPCPTCRSAVSLEERSCQKCGASLLVDVVLHSHVADGRTRYQLSRLLQALPGAPPLGAIQMALTASPPCAGRGVTRAYAHAVIPLLGEHGLRASIEKHQAPGQSGMGLSLRKVGVGVGALAILGLIWVGWQQLLHKAGPKEFRLTADDVPLAGQPAPAARGRDPRELAQLALASAVSLRCGDSVGSGFFVSPELVVTNAHVLCPGESTVQVGLSDDRKFTGQVLRSDPRVDLGLVRVEGVNARPLALGDVADIAAGDRIVIVGSPVGLDFSVQEGSVSSLQRSAAKIALIQLDAKVSPGNSGGPVINAQGKVVGIVSMKITGRGIEGIGLALPVNYVYGELGFVEPPSPKAASSAAFAQMIARAEQGAETGIRTASAEAPAAPQETPDDRPLLVAGRMDQYDRLVVTVLRVTEFPPAFEEITVTIWAGNDAFCTCKGDITTWKQADPYLASTGADAPTAAVVHGMVKGRTVFAGESPLRWDLCDRTKMRRGIQVELAGANPLVNRLIVR